jgi:ubiquinone/menaquinone biosynthesis C-methylase UbiE
MSSSEPSAPRIPAQIPESWRAFWDKDNAIYVSERHKLLHYRGLARDLSALIPSRNATVLDHGCGEALAAETLASQCGKLYLYDAAPSVVEKLSATHAAHQAITVLPVDGLSGVPEQSVDLIIANSLLQYLKEDELKALLMMWRGKLRVAGKSKAKSQNAGTLALCDIIPPDVSPITDAMALLRFAAQGGFFIAAITGLVRTALSDYRTLRQNLGLTTHAEAALSAMLTDAGYVNIRRKPQNIGHNQARFTLLADAAG